MNALRLLSLLATLLLVAGAPSLHAQVPDAVPHLAPSDTTFEVRLRDGSTLFGRITSVEGDSVVLVTSGGSRVALARAQIRSATPVRGTLRDGVVWPEDPNRTRLFFGPTGRTLRSGEGYVGAFELFFPFVAMGVTDRVTLAAGTPVVPGILGRVWYAAPKVELVARERVQLSSGVLAFADLGDTESDVIGILYGVGSWGSADQAVTAGAGWAFSGQDVAHRPVFMGGGEQRVSGRVKLITENYLFTYEQSVESSPSGEPRTDLRHVGLLSGGVRIFGERLSGDLGLGLGVGADDFGCCLPLVNFVYNFGRAR